MINTDMKTYNYFTFGELNSYGQPILSADPKGQIKIAINITSQNVQENINYSGASYIGLTYNNSVNDSYVIQYGEEKLKVLYVNPKGRLKQVFLAKM